MYTEKIAKLSDVFSVTTADLVYEQLLYLEHWFRIYNAANCVKKNKTKTSWIWRK